MQKQHFEELYALEENFWWFEGMRSITAALLDRLLPANNQRRILDAGCGTGLNLSWLSRYTMGRDVVGIDLAMDALKFSRERGEKLLSCASVVELPFCSSAFDMVTSFDVLVQLPGDDASQRALCEMYRVLRPGGILFVRVAAYEWMHSGHDRALGTQRRYSLASLNRSVEEAGFQVLRSTYANGLLLPLAAIRRLVLKPAGLADKGSDVKPLPGQFAWLDRLLYAALASEANWLRNSRNFSAGLSAICVAQRPEK